MDILRPARRYRPRIFRGAFRRPVVLANIAETCAVVSTGSYAVIVALLDYIISASTVSSKLTTSVNITENPVFSSLLSVSFNRNVAESLVVNASAILSYLNIIKESVDCPTSISSKIQAVQSILEHLVAITSFFKVSPVLITETLVTLSTILSTLYSYKTISENTAATSTASDKLGVTFLVNDKLVTSESLSNSTILKSFISESVLFLPAIEVHGNTYSGWVLNPALFAVTEYTNYNFNSLTKFQNRYFGANTTGLYEFTGAKDDQNFIQVKLETPAYDLKTSNVKQVPTMYLGVGQDNTLIIKVAVDRNNAAYYRLPLPSRELRTQTIKLGKGLVGKYFQFEVITENVTEFKLDSFEFYPIQFGRKL